jgi:hypothetical protein
MTEFEQDDWYEANQRYLMAAVAGVSALVSRHAELEEPAGPKSKKTETAETTKRLQAATKQAAAKTTQGPSALEVLCDTFNLSDFERNVLLTCAAMELDASFAPMCAAAQGDVQRSFPTFGLALAALPGPEWAALSPHAPLRFWRLIEVGPGPALTVSPLRIDERILHYLTGVNYLDERLAGVIEHGATPVELVPSHRTLAEHLAATWAGTEGHNELPVVQLCGEENAGKRAVAAAAYAMLGLDMYIIAAHSTPTGPAELDTIIRLWEREAALNDSALLLDCDEVEPSDAVREGAVARLIDRLNGLLIVSSRERRRQRQRPMLTFDVGKPTTAEQREIWTAALGEVPSPVRTRIEDLVAQFNLSAPAIHATCAGAFGSLKTEPESKETVPKSKRAKKPPTRETPTRDLETALWDTCRTQARPRLDDLAQRIEALAEWEQLILPDELKQMLGYIGAHVRNRLTVNEQWGFAKRSGRGLGISVLFAGASGTGKTMAAEVLAHDLRLDLYRIDLSAVVSKYIGETEKNLRRVFDAAEEGGAVLLFDEADALFGKRSEVKDSHDRHANIEVSYLLQRMESYRGLAILTTNLKDALDNAFLRRLRFVAQFPFPDAAQREQIWRTIFPRETPTEGIDPQKLARLDVPGGSIRNIALNAAFFAADAGEVVRMSHLLLAARNEYDKLEKPLTDSEIRGWV